MNKGRPRIYPSCPKCGAQMRGVGDVWYCTNRKCLYERPKKGD